MKLKKTGLKMYKASGALPHLVTRDTALTVSFTGWCFTVDGSQREFHLNINVQKKRTAANISNWTALFLLLFFFHFRSQPRWTLLRSLVPCLFSTPVKSWPCRLVREMSLIIWASSCNWTHSVSCYLIRLLNNISEQHTQAEVDLEKEAGHWARWIITRGGI